MRKMPMRLMTALLAGAALIGACGAQADEAPTSAPAFSYADYAALLKMHVDKAGMVNYRKLKANRGQLDAFAQSLADLDRRTYERWNKKQKIAFWVNAYNALTLKAIIDHYPIRKTTGRHPANSIRQIPGVWKKLQFPVMGKPHTLDQIEHKILRAKFAEPRIHFALVCASIGCPALHNKPFTADKLSQQLTDQSKRFLSDQKKFRLDRRENVVYLSPIFKWFGGDFADAYAAGDQFGDHDATHRSVLNFISRHVGDADAEYLRRGQYRIKYLDYDWSLNEQPPKPQPASE